MNYRPDIDGLRKIAVVPVVLFHANVTGFTGGSGPGSAALIWADGGRYGRGNQDMKMPQHDPRTKRGVAEMKFDFGGEL